MIMWSAFIAGWKTVVTEGEKGAPSPWVGVGLTKDFLCPWVNGPTKYWGWPKPKNQLIVGAYWFFWLIGDLVFGLFNEMKWANM